VRAGNEVEAPTAPRSLYPGLLVLTTVSGITGSLGSPLVPVIAKSEHVSLSLAQWNVTAAFLVGAVAAPIIGRLGAGRRRKPVLLAILLLSALGALIGALPLGIWGIIAGRSLQGLSFAATAILLAVARDFLPIDVQPRAIATISVANVVTNGLAFPVVAFVAELFGVRGAYWFALLLMTSALVLALLVVPTTDARAPSDLDYRGAILLSVGTLALLVAVSQADSWGYFSWRALGLSAMAACALGAAARWMLRTRSPLIDLRLAAVPRALGAHIATVLAGCGMYVLFSLVIVYSETKPSHGFGLGHSVLTAGLLLMPYAAASFAANRVALRLSARLEPGVVVPIGCLVFAAANLWLVVLHRDTWELLVAMTIAGVGSGLSFNSIPWLLMQVTPVEETSSALGFNVVLRFFGFALGSALAVAILDGLRDAAGRPTNHGFSVAVGTAAVICATAGATCWLLSRRRADPAQA
jgi:predicted MFS family arabinose efflux permease